MTRLSELDYVPGEWIERLEADFWITTARELLSTCLAEGGAERVATTLGAEPAALEELVQRLRQEVGDTSSLAPIDLPGMGLVPPDDATKDTK